MKQTETILRHLKSGKRITQKRAAHDYHIWRLADVIYKLRRRGHQIHTDTLKRRNRRTGQISAFAEYYLPE